MGASGLGVGAWINTSVSGSPQVVAAKYTGNAGFLLTINASGKLTFDGRRSTYPYASSGPSTTSVNDGQWHYVVGTTDGGTWNVYVDGVLESSTVSATPAGHMSINNTACSGHFSTDRTMQEYNEDIWKLDT